MWLTTRHSHLLDVEPNFTHTIFYVLLICFFSSNCFFLLFIFVGLLDLIISHVIFLKMKNK